MKEIVSYMKMIKDLPREQFMRSINVFAEYRLYGLDDYAVSKILSECMRRCEKL